MPASPPLERNRLIEALECGPFGRRRTVADLVHCLPETGSTNADLAEWAHHGVADRTVLFAEHQTAGRGRFRRIWSAPPGASMATSLLVHTRRPFTTWPWLSLLTGVAVESAISVLGVGTILKWPNDVLAANGRKLCGILAERVDTPTGPAAIIGFGLNISMDDDELPVPTATSLLLEGVAVDKTALFADIMNRLADLLDQWEAGSPEIVYAYRRRCSTIGREVRLLLDADGGTWVQGQATDVDREGRIVIDVAGRRTPYSAGDVVHLR